MIVLLIYEAILYRVTDSPGFRLLSIRKTGRSMHPQGQLPVAVNTLVVDPQVYFHEHWQTILIGLLFVLEGSKQMMRWAMWIPPLPLFGIATNQASFAAYSMILGGLLIYTGYLFLRLKRVGFWLGAGIAAAIAISTEIGRSGISPSNSPGGTGGVPSPHDCRPVLCSEEASLLIHHRLRTLFAACSVSH